MPPGGRTVLPFLLASGGAQSWVETLEVYRKCCTHLRGIYAPSVGELRHGLAQMPDSNSTALFYYTVVKQMDGAQRRPDHAIATQAIQQFKQSGNFAGMRRVFEEDIDTQARQGAQATLLLACATGLWEKAYGVLQAHPALARRRSNQRLLLTALCSAGKIKEALAELGRGAGKGREAAPELIRPIVRKLSVDGKHRQALRLIALALAGGYALDPLLFAAFLQSLRETGQWAAALETAQSLGLFSSSRVQAQKNIELFNKLINCVYGADPYADYTVEEVVREMNSRMSPKDYALRSSGRQQKFRLQTQAEIARQFSSFVPPLNDIFAKALSIPWWYQRSLSLLVDAAESSGSVILVLDTNFLLQSITKNLPLEHFYHNLKKQFPHLESGQRKLAIVVIPFTVAQEMYRFIWSPRTRLRHSLRVLLWSRVTSLIRQKNVHVLSLAVEHQTSTMGIITKMAYYKALGNEGNKNGCHDPDRRILNVCLYLQYLLRGKKAGKLCGSFIPEGTLLFSILKYHVRRFDNTVKGSATDALILCTMDQKFSRAAHEAGVDCFPALVKSE